MPIILTKISGGHHSTSNSRLSVRDNSTASENQKAEALTFHLFVFHTNSRFFRPCKTNTPPPPPSKTPHGCGAGGIWYLYRSITSISTARTQQESINGIDSKVIFSLDSFYTITSVPAIFHILLYCIFCYKASITVWIAIFAFQTVGLFLIKGMRQSTTNFLPVLSVILFFVPQSHIYPRIQKHNNSFISLLKSPKFFSIRLNQVTVFGEKPVKQVLWHCLFKLNEDVLLEVSCSAVCRFCIDQSSLFNKTCLSIG